MVPPPYPCQAPSERGGYQIVTDNEPIEVRTTSGVVDQSGIVEGVIDVDVG